MGELPEPKKSAEADDELFFRLSYDLERRMGELDESYEDFKVKRKLAKTMKKLGLGKTAAKHKFLEATMKVFNKHHKTLKDLDD